MGALLVFGSMAEVAQSRIWRPSPLLRFVAYGGVLLAVAIGASIIAAAAAEGVWWQGAAFVVAFIWVPAVIGLRYARRARVEVFSDRLLVVTTFSQRAFRWDEIRDAIPGYAGITLVLRDGSTYLAGAVQKNNSATWLHSRTPADELADLIKSRATAAA
jgi:hypothetical protein